MRRSTPTRLPEACRRFLPLLAAHLDGQLKGRKLDETLAHLDACGRCQSALSAMQEASRRYRTLLLPPLYDGEDANAAFLAEQRAATELRLDAAGYWRGAARRFAFSAKLAAIVGLFALIGLGGTAAGIALSREPDSAITPASAVPVASVPAPGTTDAESVPPEASVRTPTSVTEETTTAPVEAETVAPDTETAAAPVPAPKPAKPKPKPTKPTKPVPPASIAEPKPKPPKPPPRDKTAPVVSITRAPEATTSSAAAEITFSSNEADVTFACRLDAGDFHACASPVALAGLAEGSHTFAVRATDKAGNVGADATASWAYAAPDTTSPQVTITIAPTATGTDQNPRFSFAANEPDVVFACALDGAAGVPCTSPFAYSKLGYGPHAFSVFATDQAGNAGQPATHSWTIVRPLPDLKVAAFTQSSIVITNSGAATAGPSVLTITLVGTFQVPSIPAGGSVTFNWSTCRRGTYAAIVDRTSTVTESDETNNTGSFASTCIG